MSSRYIGTLVSLQQEKSAPKSNHAYAFVNAYNIWKWRPMQQTAPRQCCEQLREFGAMKTLSGRIAPHCDKHQFCDKMMVSTWTVFELPLFEQSGRNEERITKMALLLPHTFAFSCLSHSFWALIRVLLIIKEEGLALLAYLWWSYMAFA